MVMSTNELVRADFNTTCREVLLTAYERELEGDRLPQSFEGKPLDHLMLNIARVRQPSASGPIAEERLEITPLDVEDAIEIRDLPQFEDSPDYVFERYATLAYRIAQISLDQTVRLSDELPHGTVVSTYVADYLDGKEEYLNSLFDETSAVSLSHGVQFAENALAYVNSSRFYDIKVIGRPIVLGPDESEGQIEHKFGYDMTPDLPLNGHEPINFLVQYHKKMSIRLNQVHSLLVHAHEDGVSDASLGQYRDQIAIINSAIKRAEKILENKGY